MYQYLSFYDNIPLDKCIQLHVLEDNVWYSVRHGKKILRFNNNILLFDRYAKCKGFITSYNLQKCKLQEFPCINRRLGLMSLGAFNCEITWDRNHLNGSVW